MLEEKRIKEILEGVEIGKTALSELLEYIDSEGLLKKAKDIISEELLSEVFTDGEQDFEVIGICLEDPLLLEYNWIKEQYSEDGFKRVPVKINIHQLAHICKKWAINKGWHLSIDPLEIRIGQKLDLMYFKHRILNESKKPYDPVDVIRACEWIKDNK